MQERFNELRQWVVEKLTAITGLEKVIVLRDVESSWRSVAGDASARRYYRCTCAASSYIIADAPVEQENPAEFVRIAEMMRAADVMTPLIYFADLQRGFLLMQDFGDSMLKNYLAAHTGQQLFDGLLPVLERLASCPTDGLPVFSEKMFTDELALFTDWYLGRHCDYVLTKTQRQQWQQLCDLLLRNASAQRQVFVHRDFHSCNLHALNDVLSMPGTASIGVIDFQDAVIGPISYDLISWLWDRYMHWPRAEIEHWMQQAAPVLAPEIPLEQWRQHCDLMGLQRNLKIVGIFSRLNYRDKKQGYLEMIPQFIRYINDIIQYSADLAFAMPFFAALPGFDSPAPN